MFRFCGDPKSPTKAILSGSFPPLQLRDPMASTLLRLPGATASVATGLLCPALEPGTSHLGFKGLGLTVKGLRWGIRF